MPKTVNRYELNRSTISGATDRSGSGVLMEIKFLCSAIMNGISVVIGEHTFLGKIPVFSLNFRRVTIRRYFCGKKKQNYLTAPFPVVRLEMFATRRCFIRIDFGFRENIVLCGVRMVKSSLGVVV